MEREEEKKMNIYRHGDIVFYPVENPKTKEEREHNTFIVAEGEATGHHHRLEGAVAVMTGFNEEVYVRLTKPTNLTHQEHKTLTIVPGTYEIRREREWDYFENERRKVLD